MTDSIFRDNLGDVYGGAVYITDGSISNSIFEDNESDQYGGALAAVIGTVSLTNNLIVNNTAAAAGAIYSYNATLTVSNTTISGNNATLETFGDGIFVNGGTVTLNNSILANNDGGEECVRNNTPPEETVNTHHSLIEGGLTCVNGTAMNNLTGDPALNADFTLSSGSIAIDAGSDSLIPAGITTDLAGNDRLQGHHVDMGAYETTVPLVTIQLALQARPAAPHLSYVVSGDVEVRPQGGGTPILVTTFTSNNQGRFLLSRLPFGTYEIWVKGVHTLARMQTFTYDEASTLLTTALLLEGDANDNNLITTVDFSILATAFGTMAGDPLYDARADFNQDGVVSLVDFSLLSSNFGLEGDP